jgi:hypothetical protein
MIKNLKKLFVMKRNGIYAYNVDIKEKKEYEDYGKYERTLFNDLC